MIFVDTNVLLYAFGKKEGGSKAEKAREILLRDDLVLSVQVLQEFYVQATRVSRLDALSHEEAIELIRIWLRFPIVELTVSVMQAALRVKQRYQISYWDAAVVAAAATALCAELFSEDLNDGQTYEGVTVINPFKNLK